MQNRIGVTFPQGFQAAGVACGLKKNGNHDLALVVCDGPAAAAGMFTRNVVKGHSLQLAQQHVSHGAARAVVINAGCANACVGPRGMDDALAVCAEVGSHIGCLPQEVLPGSTGVIGYPLPMEKMMLGIRLAFETLSSQGGHEAAKAIMTTDTHPKEAGIEIMLGGKAIRIGGMAKGSGMIHPNMATMISVLTTDAVIDAAALQQALHTVTERTFNRVSVDGDTSVCDKVVLLAGGKACNSPIQSGTAEYDIFVDGLGQVCETLSRMLAADGEGATKLLTIQVKHAPSDADAHLIASAIAKSPLCKTAAFGQDANWGRILTAAGYSGAAFDPDRVDVYIGSLQTCQGGMALSFDEDAALRILQQHEVIYTLDMHQGEGTDTMWTCDFSYDYVKINGSYRS